MKELITTLPLTATQDEINHEYRKFCQETLKEINQKVIYQIEDGVKTLVSVNGRQIGCFYKVRRNGRIIFKFDIN